MNDPVQASGATLLMLLAGVVGLVTVTVAVTRGARLFPLRRLWRRRIERWTPVVGSVVTVVYIGWSVTVLFRGRGLPAYAVLLVLALVLLAITWTGLRDVVAGVMWRASRRWNIGDPITVGELRGRIASLGYRAVALDTDRGEQTLVPYTLLLREAVTLRGMAAGDIPHQFTVPAPPGASLDRVREQLQRSLALCHGVSLLREPRVRLASDGAVEITVFVLSADFASRVEACARCTVEAGTAAAEDEPLPPSTTSPTS